MLYVIVWMCLFCSHVTSAASAVLYISKNIMLKQLCYALSAECTNLLRLYKGGRFSSPIVMSSLPSPSVHSSNSGWIETYSFSIRNLPRKYDTFWITKFSLQIGVYVTHLNQLQINNSVGHQVHHCVTAKLGTMAFKNTFFYFLCHFTRHCMICCFLSNPLF